MTTNEVVAKTKAALVEAFLGIVVPYNVLADPVPFGIKSLVEQEYRYK